MLRAETDFCTSSLLSPSSLTEAQISSSMSQIDTMTLSSLSTRRDKLICPSTITRTLLPLFSRTSLVKKLVTHWSTFSSKEESTLLASYPSPSRRTSLTTPITTTIKLELLSLLRISLRAYSSTTSTSTRRILTLCMNMVSVSPTPREFSVSLTIG